MIDQEKGQASREEIERVEGGCKDFIQIKYANFKQLLQYSTKLSINNRLFINNL